MLKTLKFFDRTALSILKIPLPLNSNERIMFFCDNVYFRFKTKQSSEIMESFSGKFYLTTLRIVYVPDRHLSFTTFHIPLTKLFLVESDSYLECLCENSYIGLIFVNFRSKNKNLYFSEIDKAIKRVEMDVDSILIEDDPDTLPYYSEFDF